MSLRRILGFLFLFPSLLLILPRLALAYLDPGAGSFAIQFLLAGVVAVLFLLKTYWTKVKTFFSSHFVKGNRVC